MGITYHNTAWECPKCGRYTAVSRYKLGSHIRRCRNKRCRMRVMVTVHEKAYDTVVYRKEITSQPVDMGV